MIIGRGTNMGYLLDLRQCGSMELGESLEEVVIREMYEESGLTPDNIGLLKVFSGQEFYYQYPHV